MAYLHSRSGGGSARLVRLCAVLALAGLAGGCGEDGEPRPGATDPCFGAAAGVLGCPASSQASAGSSGTLDVQRACRKLVNCGILAGEFLGTRGSACSGDADCGTGECLPNSEGTPVCHFHLLDYQWCISRLVGDDFRGDRLCNNGDFQQAEVDRALGCMARTECAALGAPFDFKARSRSSRPDIDKYTCNDGTPKFTATVCDAGLLSY